MKPLLKGALDIANYAGMLETETVREWAAQRITKVIVRASTESDAKRAITRQQLGMCQARRLLLEAYIWLYFAADESPFSQVEKAVLVCKDYGVERYWLDCEETSPWSPDETVEYIRQAVKACEMLNVATGIYTRRQYWQDVTGNSTAFSHLPLWDADPSGKVWGDFVEYGGWRQRSMWQHTLDASLAGKTVDLNVYDAREG